MDEHDPTRPPIDHRDGAKTGQATAATPITTTTTIPTRTRQLLQRQPTIFYSIINAHAELQPTQVNVQLGPPYLHDATTITTTATIPTSPRQLLHPTNDAEAVAPELLMSTP